MDDESDIEISPEQLEGVEYDDQAWQQFEQDLDSQIKSWGQALEASLREKGPPA